MIFLALNVAPNTLIQVKKNHITFICNKHEKIKTYFKKYVSLSTLPIKKVQNFDRVDWV